MFFCASSVRWPLSYRGAESQRRSSLFSCAVATLELKDIIPTMKQLGTITFCLFVCVGAGSDILAQRKAVSGAEVTGTFRSYFTRRFKDSYNEILIQALGGNKLKIEMNLVHPYEASAGISVNVGSASGESVIQGDTAVFTPADATGSSCKITLRFAKPGTLIVTTENNVECGFGHNVSADGTYKKTSSAKPKFGAN